MTTTTDVCQQGHPLDDENTYTNPTSGFRTCRRCRRQTRLQDRRRRQRERDLGVYSAAEVARVLERIRLQTLPLGVRGCRAFTGYRRRGIPYITWNGIQWTVARLLYHLTVKPIFKGNRLIRDCETRGCINPHHYHPTHDDEFYITLEEATA